MAWHGWGLRGSAAGARDEGSHRGRAAALLCCHTPRHGGNGSGGIGGIAGRGSGAGCCCSAWACGHLCSAPGSALPWLQPRALALPARGEHAWGPARGCLLQGCLCQGCPHRSFGSGICLQEEESPWAWAAVGIPTHGQAACSPCRSAVPYCQDGCQGRGCPARHPLLRTARIAALAGLGEPRPVLCACSGVEQPHRCLPRCQRRDVHRVPRAVSSGQRLEQAPQSRAGICRLLLPSACTAHATHGLKPGPGTWESQGRAKPPAQGWWVWPGCSDEARLAGASDAPASGQALMVPFPCALAEPL